MFTGIIQAVGRVRRVSAQGRGVRLSIDPGPWKHRALSGESISINGVCLTVAASDKGGAKTGRALRSPILHFDAVPETLSKTTLGNLRSGSVVNLEHAATPNTLLGGHLVLGHVDGVGTLAKVQRGGDWRLWIALPRRGLAQYIVPKGSICIDGVSLTVAELWSKGFQVALIPTTLKKTTLARLHPGDRVNLETDLVVKTVVHWLATKRRAKGGRHK